MSPFVKQQSAWGFVCGRVSVLEGLLAPEDFFVSLAGQERLEDVASPLQGTFLGPYVERGSGWEDFSALADQCFHDHATALRENCPSPVPVDILLVQWDYLNLRNALSGSEAYPFPPTLLAPEALATAAAGDLSALPAPWDEVLAGVAGEGSGIDPLVIDMALDGAYLRHVLRLSEELGSPLIAEWARSSVLARSVVVLWRALLQGLPLRPFQQHFLPVGEATPVLAELVGTANAAAWGPMVGDVLGEFLAESADLPEEERVPNFEWRAGNYLTRLAGEGRMQTAGPERVFAFVVHLHAEMQNLKLVVCGQQSGIGPDVLRRRLRACYG